MLPTDNTLLTSIQAYSDDDVSYWSFRGRSRRENCHALIQYPAMMVPEMQGELIDAVLQADTNVKVLFDPFVGSGTTLGEAMCRGLDFVGMDINPLAILACEVKSGPLYIDKLSVKVQELLQRIEEDVNETVEVNFDGIDKWFTKTAQIDLSSIYRAIKLEPAKWARKIFWLSMSNTVRSVCNSRSSTFKLHIKTQEQIDTTPPATDVFEKNLAKNVENISSQKELFLSKNVLNKYKSASKVRISHVDTSKPAKKVVKCDLLVSSPPYGDNHTTVTYGQFSYLPLMWIDLNDIDNLGDQDLLSNTCAIDSSSLGGSKKGASGKLDSLKDITPSLLKVVHLIEQDNPDNIKKLVSFIFDLDKALDNAVEHLRDNAYMIWTLGNRRISNIEIPLDKIMKELLESKGCTFIHQLERDIPTKRMAKRNKVASTMDKEIILIMRR